MTTQRSVPTVPSVTTRQANAFRVARQHLGFAGAESLADLCRDTGGIQAQVMSAAEIALWTRCRDLQRDRLGGALWRERELIRTSCMRLTLHLVAARDFSLFITALKPSSAAILQRILARLRATPAQVTAINDVVLEAVDEGPRTQQEIVAVAKGHAGRAMRVWLEHAWSAVRPAVVEGLICYGPPRGSQATFVRADRWLPRQPVFDVATAQGELLRRFLRAFGPATPRDFAKWSGLGVANSTMVWNAIEGELLPVTVDGSPAAILRGDADALLSAEPEEATPRLLPAFDSLLLAHAKKDHLVARQHYKRVYRPQGWLSPVVLVGGAVAGVWFATRQGKSLSIDVQPFVRFNRRLRDRTEEEASAMARFLGQPCRVRFSEPR